MIWTLIEYAALAWVYMVILIGAWLYFTRERDNDF